MVMIAQISRVVGGKVRLPAGGVPGQLIPLEESGSRGVKTERSPSPNKDTSDRNDKKKKHKKHHKKHKSKGKDMQKDRKGPEQAVDDDDSESNMIMMVHQMVGWVTVQNPDSWNMVQV